MTRAAVDLVPEIEAELVDMAAAHGCLGSALCGSGSAVFGVFATLAEAAAAVAGARERGLWAAAARAGAGGTIDQVTPRAL